MKKIAGTWGEETVIVSNKNKNCQYRAIPSYGQKDKFILGKIDNEVAQWNVSMQYLNNLKQWVYKKKESFVKLKEFDSIEDILEYLNK